MTNITPMILNNIKMTKRAKLWSVYHSIVRLISTGSDITYPQTISKCQRRKLISSLGVAYKCN